MASIGPPNEDESDESDNSDLPAYPGLEAAALSIIENYGTRKDLTGDAQEYSNGRIIFLTSLERYLIFKSS